MRLCELVRALGLFFDLANVAEDRHRVRVLHQRQAAGNERETFATAVREMGSAGLSRAAIKELVSQLQVELVLTAHPTEAKRRTERRILRRLHRDLETIDRGNMGRRERANLLGRMRRNLIGLWYVDPLRPRRPTVLEELERNLFAVHTLWQVTPRVFRHFNEALEGSEVDPIGLASSLRFGNWIGGDRDGNPNVTAEVTAEALRSLRRQAVRLHLHECRRMENRLIYSRERLGDIQISAALARAREQWPQLARRLNTMHPAELHRQYLALIEYRLRRSLIRQTGVIGSAGYATGAELAKDLAVLESSLRADGLHEIADWDLRAWQQRTKVFGLHLVRMDIRENSRRLRQGVGELMAVLGRCPDWSKTTEYQRQRLLVEAPPDLDPALLSDGRVSESTADLARLFENVQRHGCRLGAGALGGLIVSMTHQPSDVLSMVWLNRLGAKLAGCGGGGVPLPAVPLFETYDDLDRAGYMLSNLLDIREYREYVRASGNQQMCMVGYSDSTKDAGYVAANWALYRGQQDLAEVASRYNIDLVVFHGRGGALGRGGGPAARAIRSLPAEAVRGRFRMTEQGEVIADRFDVPALAFRHLEQVLWATLLVSGVPQQTPRYEWLNLFRDMSRTAQQAYFEFISADGFLEYFYRATPIATIEQLPISSRPSRRSGQASIDDLRAIPYTFAWTQSRHCITAFFGLGAAYESLDASRREMIGEMYRRWPFFQAVIDNAELGLTKTEPAIARYYASLASGDGGSAVWELFAAERERTARAVLAITGQHRLLQRIPWLARQVAIRDPYLDALNLIQVEVLRRQSANGGGANSDSAPVMEPGAATDLDRAARLCIQAIASGLRSTG